MNKILKVIGISVIKILSIFIISSIFIYLIVGYMKNGVYAQPHWDVGVTTWDKLWEYYVRTFPYNIKPVLVLSLITTIIIGLKRIICRLLPEGKKKTRKNKGLYIR